MNTDGLKNFRRPSRHLIGSTLLVLLCLIHAETPNAQGLEFDEVPISASKPANVLGPFNKQDIQYLRTAGTIAKGPISARTLDDLPSSILAQHTANYPLHSQRPVKKSIDPRFTPQTGNSYGYVSSVEIKQREAAWIKIKFRKFDLGDAVLHISSPGAKHLQTLDNTSIREWSWYSAIFQGDSVTVEMFVKPDGSIPVGLSLSSLIASVIKGRSLSKLTPYPDTISTNDLQEQSLPPGDEFYINEEGICQSDKRVFTTDKRVARMRPAGCTVFILEGGVFASAGHCFRVNADKQQVEFNVGPSSNLGTMRDASPENIYPVDISKLYCNDCDKRYVTEKDKKYDLPHGTDWALFKLHPNSKTRARAEDQQGPGFTIPKSISASSADSIQNVFVLGYGDDNDPAEARHALQTGNGKYHGVEIVPEWNLHRVLHEVDTRKGNSGSPIVSKDGDSDRFSLIGIHTGGRCFPDRNMLNSGTSILHPDLLSAYKELTGLDPLQ